MYEASKVGAALAFAGVHGQEAVKRAITISAAGRHHLLRLCQIKPCAFLFHFKRQKMLEIWMGKKSHH